MKKRYSLLIALMTFTLAVVAQTAPQKINYQTVERSHDGIAFQSIGCVYSSATDGNSNEKIAYTYPDRTMLTGVNYYRLKQVGKDNQLTYSFIISLEHISMQQGDFTLSPNPTKGKVYFSATAITDRSFIQVYDVSGKEIKLLKLTASSTEIDLGHVASGVYFILYSDGQNSKLVKIVKE